MNTHEQAPDKRARLIQLIVADLLGETSASEQAEVARALAADPALVRERERLSATIGLVRGLADGAPAEVLPPAASARLAAAAAGRAASVELLPGPGSQRRAWYASPVFRAAASLALALGAFAIIRGTGDRNLTPAENVAKVERATAGEARSSHADSLRKSGSAGAIQELEIDSKALGDVAAKEAGKNNALAMTAEASGEQPLDRFEPQSAPASVQLGQDLRLQSELAEQVVDGPKDAVLPSAMLAATPSVGEEGGRFGGHGSRVSFGGRGKAKQAATALAEPAPAGQVASGADEFFLGRGEAQSIDGRAFNDVSGGKRGEVADGPERLRGLGYIGDDEDGLEDAVRRQLVSLGYTEELPEGDRLSSLAPEARSAAIEGLFSDCRRRPQEHAHDMFYRWWGDNPFEDARNDHLSTFAADVDTASYTLARRYLAEHKLPEKAQIRTEEFVNYFKGDVSAPTEETFGLSAELAPSLFNAAPDTWMLRVALRGREVARSERKPLALTFVVDVSGSMQEQNRLELVKHALRLLVGELDGNDSVALVAFSNEARLVLPMTSARNRGLIESAIHPLAPQGGTNVAAGLRMGYEAALVGLAPAANNRVVFLSDGVGNIGETDAQVLSEQVEHARKRGIYLNTVGVGMNNHNDAFLEQLANRGDGICNYVDDEREARRALVENFTCAFEPIARDVKIQVEFDPAQVERYRLLGYENRAVADVEFRNDAVDAGEVGSGHQVVALYELERANQGDGEAPLATVRLRWKAPFAQVAGNQMEELPAREAAWTIRAGHAAGSFAATSPGYRRSVLVGQLAEVLRRSIHARSDSLESLLAEARKLAPELRDPDFDEFVKMIESTIELIATEWGRYDVLARRLDALRMENYLRAQIEDSSLEVERSKLEALDARVRDLEAEIRRALEPGPDDSMRVLGYYK